jgi:hypothetical protein
MEAHRYCIQRADPDNQRCSFVCSVERLAASTSLPKMKVTQKNDMLSTAASTRRARGQICENSMIVLPTMISRWRSSIGVVVA